MALQKFHRRNFPVFFFILFFILFFSIQWNLSEKIDRRRIPFEEHFIRKKTTKQQRRRAPRFDPGKHTQESSLKVETPIFVASLPKSGTTSVWQYFNCGKEPASHQWTKVNETYTEPLAKCIQRNILQDDRPPFEQCGSRVFTDTGYATRTKQGYECYYPSIQALEQIHRHYPTSTIVLVVRDTEAWYQSISTWGQGSLLERWKNCPDFPLSETATPQEVKQFYEWHTQQIQTFVKSHPSLKLVQVQLESNETGTILEQQIGIPSKCWAKCSPTSKFCDKITQ